ncbi:pantothenate transporter liz1/hypothetical protein [Blumeria hordei DH14]|uniref:Thioesterase domain-containing protein n=1 Tax=Blumeria graminis f. sp. hordei (strain DH14) TaxID=546991 RepID=N1JIB7_BLUG1|nr:pantothenate transporter liz1/hypothetical protein [Blumeria hordei DH14]
MTTQQDLKRRSRTDYHFWRDFQTRWSDNDMYDHMNNSIYNALYDAIVNIYLVEECQLHPPTSPQYGLVVHSEVDFFGAISFPAVAEVALRVNKIGKSSVTYEVALFEKNCHQVKSVGTITHVFVDRDTGRPAAKGMSLELAANLRKILVVSSKL